MTSLTSNSCCARVASRERCVECKRAYGRARYRANKGLISQQRSHPDRIATRRAAHNRRRYNLQPDDYTRLLEQQMHRCAVCFDPFGDKTPHVDHDHRCCPTEPTCGTCTRGLLHGTCNRALGMLREDPATMRRAADYLLACGEGTSSDLDP